MPAAEVEVTEALVRELLAVQHPDLAGLELRELANGWDNVIFRLGDDLTVRLPRREMAAALVGHEQRWLPELAERLPLPIPAPVRVGSPGLGYPWGWSVCPWFEGTVAADAAPADPRREARRLGAFVAALHTDAPSDAPPNPYRAMPVVELTERVDANLAKLGTVVDTENVRRLWSRLVDGAEWSGPRQWVHGDLHLANVLVHDGAIAAVIDFGDIASGDPAVDLAIGWMLFAPAERAVFRSAAGPLDDATWRRGRAWALHFALMYLAHSADNQRFGRMGADLLAAVSSSVTDGARHQT